MRGPSDRPLHRKLWKLGLRAMRGRALAHAQDWTPGLRIEGGRILHRGRDLGAGLAALDWQGSAPITIVGSGPSVARQDLSGIAAPRCILLNGALTLAGGPLAGAGAFAIEDERFVWRRFDIVETAPRGALALLSVQAIRAIAETSPGWFEGRRVVLVDNAEKPYGAPRRAAEDPELRGVLDRRFGAPVSVAPSRGVAICGTVAFTALQFALAARPPRIGLAGVELSNAAGPRFYEREGQSAPSGLSEGLERIRVHFAAARALAEERGTTLLCHAPGSALIDLGYRLDPLPEAA